jgi:hypothetical protein
VKQVRFSNPAERGLLCANRSGSVACRGVLFHVFSGGLSVKRLVLSLLAVCCLVSFSQAAQTKKGAAKAPAKKAAAAPAAAKPQKPKG